MKSSTVQNYIFYIILILFFLYFVHQIRDHSLHDSLIDSIALWAASVVATPIPSTGLLLLIPLKLLFDVPMHYAFIIVASLSLFIVFHYQKYELSFVRHILDNKLYSIFVIAMISSATINVILNIGIDYLSGNKPIPVTTTIALSIVSVILVLLYGYTLTYHGIKIE